MWNAPVAREQRKLAATLAADVVGYSRLMCDDRDPLARFHSTLNGESTSSTMHKSEVLTEPGTSDAGL
jgi:hypothetical protein